MASPPKGKRARVANLIQMGQRVRDCREKRDWSQMELAAKMGAAQGWLSELERGQHKSMEVDTVIRLARELGVSADYLLGMTDDQVARVTPRRKRKDETKHAAAMAWVEAWYATPDTQPSGYWEAFEALLMEHPIDFGTTDLAL